MNTLMDKLPTLLASWGVLIALCIGVTILIVAIKVLMSGRSKAPAKSAPKLLESLAEYPPAPAGALHCRLLIDSIPVRLRLVVLAPIGDVEVNLDDAEEILDRLAPRLGDVARQDRPRVRLWPRQVSASGFAQQFNANVVTPEADGEQSEWILVAGRAKIGKRALMIGLAAQSKTPTSIGAKTVDIDDWTRLLQVRVK